MWKKLKKNLPIFTYVIFLFGCAQVVSPTGGIKDIIPPQLIASNPENKATNFKGNTITLTFDEYVILDNIIQKLIITPEIDNPYTPIVKKESVILKFKKQFADSTTYTFNFGDGIKDFAERNPAQNLKLVFSTGSVIDSGRVYGSVLDIRTNKPVFDALVGLYQITDSLTPEKNKPYYFSRTDSSGRFAIENTQIANYALIALNDKNHNLLYNPKEEGIAFLDSIITVNADTSNYTLQMFHSDITPLRVQRTIPKVNDYTIAFNKGIDSIDVVFQDGTELPYIMESPNQLKFFNVPVQEDTVRAQIIAIDSLGYELSLDQKIRFMTQRSRERQTTPLTVKPIIPNDEAVALPLKLTLQFNKPIDHFDPDHLKIKTDSISLTEPHNLEPHWNRYRNKLTLEIQYPAKDSIIVQFNKGAFISVEGDTLAATKIKHPIINPERYGIIRGTINNPNEMPFFIELTDKDFKTIVFKTDKNPFEFKNIKPGDYRLRLIVDINNNGKWDTGNYSRKLQPEPILVFPNLINVKANFEYEDQYFDLSSFSMP